MKTVEEHYQDWYNERSGDHEMDLAIEFVDKYACEFAEYYIKQLGLFDVSHCYPEAFCEYLAENYTKNLGVWFPKNADQKLETNRRSIKQLYDKWHRVNCG